MAKMEEDVLFSNLRDKLFTAVVGDVLDKMGWRRQFLPQAIAPLKPEMKVVGRAMPVLEADVFEETSRAPGALIAKPFGLMLEALDDLRPNEVYVATGGSFRYAFWGELMSTRARYLHAAGAVLNGFVRDAVGIEVLGFPTFSRGSVRARPGPTRQSHRLSHGRRNRRGADCARRSDLRRSGGRSCHSCRNRGRSDRSGPQKSVDREQGRNRHSRRHGRAPSVRHLRRPLIRRVLGGLGPAPETTTR